MKTRPAAIVVLVLASAGLLSADNRVAAVDQHGRIESLTLGNQAFPFKSNIRIPTREWAVTRGLEDAVLVKGTLEEKSGCWTGLIDLAENEGFTFEQSVHELGGTVHIHLRVTADTDIEAEGVFFWVNLPVETYAGWQCILGSEDAPRAVLPAECPADPRFLGGNAGRVQLVNTETYRALEIGFDRVCDVRVQDNREWNENVYALFVMLGKNLARGDSAELRVTVRLVEPDRKTARLYVDARSVLGRIDGFGGNYCFNIDRPTTQYTLDNLRVAWARARMTLAEWEPRNDNADPNKVAWEALKKNDRPDTNLRREFTLAKRIQEMGIPYAVAIWRLPEWCYEQPLKEERSTAGRVRDGMWPEVQENIESYLVYAKKTYGVEPDLLSFNEANLGVYVRLSDLEHCEVIKRLGRRFKKLGLKTRLLLGDVHRPDAMAYCDVAADDPDAMDYVGALAFHSWGGGDPGLLRKWADLARKLKVPLLVTELGVDPGAWKDKSFDTFDYAMREVRLYQDLVRYACPQGTMQWEFSDNYGIVRLAESEKTGAVTVKPSHRFWFIKHFCNLTPPNAEILETKSDHAEVLLTAFRARQRRGTAYTLHIANLGVSRQVTVTGIPRGVLSLRVVRTSERESFRELPAVAVNEGSLVIELPARSLSTLTTEKRNGPSAARKP